MEGDSESCTDYQTLVLPESKLYHLFVSYASEDKDKVLDVVDQLEKVYGVKCLVADRDFQAGKPIRANIEEGMRTSLKTLMFLTPNFTKSEYCKHEADLAFQMSVDQQEECVIPVLLEKCEIPYSIKPITYIDATLSEMTMADIADKVLKTLKQFVTGVVPSQTKEICHRSVSIVESEYKSRRRAPTLQGSKLYHFYVCYATEDRKRVYELVKEIENTYGARCLFAERDFQPGKGIRNNIEEGIDNSMKLLTILTPSFTQSGYCMHEAEIGFQISVKSRSNYEIPVVLEDCRVPYSLKTKTYIDATEPGMTVIEIAERIMDAINQTETFDAQLSFKTIVGDSKNRNGLTVDIEAMLQSINEKVEMVLRPFERSNEDYKKIMDLMTDNFERGLCKATNGVAKVKMFPSYVTQTPDGKEAGDFLVLDLGGTHLRVSLISLDKNTKPESKDFVIPQTLKIGHGSQLFDHIAKRIFEFLKTNELLDRDLPLGFIFSFPCRQEGLDRAVLTQWTKGFKCDGVIGHDAVQLLHEAIARRGDIKVKCIAVMNNCVGALMASASDEQDCAIGLILGAGTNASYLERIENVELWDEEQAKCSQVIINTEWGAFGDDGALDFIQTEYDRQVDTQTSNPGCYTYEKMISGMCMGEIVRLILETLIKYGLLFKGRGSDELATAGRFYSKYISEIESDVDFNFKNTIQIFKELNLEYTTEDCRIVKNVCSKVSTRAAYLASAGIACLLNKMNRPNVVVAVDGPLYRVHPLFRHLMMVKVEQFVNPGIKFRLMLSQDESGKGAALVAAFAKKKLQKNNNSF